MNTKLKIAILTVIGLLTGCSSGNPSTKTTTNYVYYQFNSDRILAQIESGEKLNVFTQIDENVLPDNALYEQVFTSEDYRSIVSAFQDQIMNDPLSNWEIFRTDYYSRCNSNKNGFTNLSIWFMKQKRNFLTVTINQRLMYLNSEFGILEYYDETYSQSPFGLKSNNTFKKKISPEKAFQIFDGNRGKTLRGELKDACNISIESQHNSTYTGWLVQIMDENLVTELLSSVIDYESGNEITIPKKQ